MRSTLSGEGGGLAIATVRGLITGPALASLTADLAQAERADRVSAAVVVFDGVVVVASAAAMFAADQRLLDAGLLRYPRSFVVDPEDYAVFDEYSWAITRGPTPHCRLIFLDAVQAASWTRLVARGWWALNSLQEAHCPQPLQALREALRGGGASRQGRRGSNH
jgi:hypothetical protein